MSDSTQKKSKLNDWLTDIEFIQNSSFSDKYYFEALGKYLTHYLKIIPVPVVTIWMDNEKRIKFSIGDNVKEFKIDSDISYLDYIVLVDRWLSDFFPQYNITLEINRKLTEDEIIELREEAIKNNKKFDLNDALNQTKPHQFIEKGIITRIYMTNDEFTFVENDKTFIKMSTIPLSIFLKKLRNIENDEDKKNFILQNSVELRTFTEDNNPTIISYSGKKMINFFLINYIDLKDKPLKSIKENKGTYRWGRFLIKFDNYTLEKECLEIYNKKRIADSLNKEEAIKELMDNGLMDKK